ncbi:IS4 family transposase [Bacteroides sp. 51]|uniref:IS4 family transposase n=1 Tax=Bacteroides sp. 51 TaxID=2302938 RepID=UPI0013D0DBA3|nr:IS4 family transposase [Bacteroides sp. 51]NDV84983.1 IS4 family transposase [Bacteroides sp. 51]
MNQGKTVFAQLMSLIPEHELKKCINRYNGDFHSIKFTCRDQFMVMSFAQFTNRSGLRDIEATLTAFSSKLYHAGLKLMPKSTLAEINEKKDWRIYQDFAQVLISQAKELYAKDYFRLDLDNMVYAFDSSTIEVCLQLCPWAHFHHKKGAFKMHTLLDLRGSIPTFVYLTDGKVHDSQIMDDIPVEAGAYYLMDKGYVDFDRLYKLFQQQNAFFVTRAKDNMVYEIKEEREVDTETGLISDQSILLTGYYSSKYYPDVMRMVVYEDFRKGIVYRFLSNDFLLPAITIAELYRQRWAIELFFKWIKQHLHIKTFFGTSQNAVYTQIWIAICDYLLLIIAKKKFHLEQSLYIISNAVGLVLFEKIPISKLFERIKKLNINQEDENQLTIW